jgi:hypothetical protein
MILGANFSPGSGPGIPLNMSLLLRFGGQVTTKKGTTWLVANEKGSHLEQISPSPAPTESPKRFPKRSFPRRCKGSPRSCCLSNVCRRPPPRSRLPVRVAASPPRQVKAAQEDGRLGAGALVLALTGVADLSSRTGGSYPLLGADEACARAASETSLGTPCRSACCNRWRKRNDSPRNSRICAR